MYVDKLYVDEAIRLVLANGVAANATAEWPWLVVSRPGEALVRRRGLRTVWGKIVLYTYEDHETLEVGFEGYLADNPFFDLGQMWGNGVALGTYLSDLVSMHFARLTRTLLIGRGWELDDDDEQVGRIFRISSALRISDLKQSVRLGKALGAALVRANVEQLSIACQGRAYLEALKDFAEVPTRPIPFQADLD